MTRVFAFLVVLFGVATVALIHAEETTDYRYEFAPEVVASSVNEANSWPVGLDKEPASVARVVYRGHSPFIEINGKLHDPLVNICLPGDPYNDSAIVRCSQLGFEIVQLNFVVNHMYRGEGVPYDFSPIEKAVRRLLQLNPNAYFILSLRFGMPKWAAEHPEEQVGYGTGPADPGASDELYERPVRASAASDKFRVLALGVIKELSVYVNARPWGKRMVGFRPSYGIYTEWHCYGMYDAPDTGLRMQEKFRAYEKAKRGIADAKIPTAAMRRHENSDLEKMVIFLIRRRISFCSIITTVWRTLWLICYLLWQARLGVISPVG